MKAKVFVRPKAGILDPEGKAIGTALGQLGFEGVDAVRAGRYFELDLSGYADAASAEEAVRRMCQELLSNPLVQDFECTIDDRSGPDSPRSEGVGSNSDV
jgi:phosphoribosylformylglycinamidine synthase PurS subunit